MKVAEEAWVATALLQAEHPERQDFAVQEIKQRARQEGWVLRPGFHQHVSSHCVANKPADPANHRMLYEDSRGRKRLYREGDPCHPDRQQGKVRPEKYDLPQQYQDLTDWYDSLYARRSSLQQTGPNKTSLKGSSSKLPDQSSPGIPVSPATAYVSSAGAFVIPEDLRKELGIQEGTRLGIYREKDRLVLQPITKEFIRSVVGCAKGETSLVEARELQHRAEK